MGYATGEKETEGERAGEGEEREKEGERWGRGEDREQERAAMRKAVGKGWDFY